MAIERAEIRHVTHMGVVLCFATVRPLPNDISLYFPDDGLQRPGRVRWRDGRLAGVEFIKPIALPERWRRGNHSARRPVALNSERGPGCRIDF